jgi:uncharacterized protein YcbX
MPSAFPETARVFAIYRYPIKGLSGERLTRVEVSPGATLPNDRAYALENGPSGFDPAAPSWQPKIKFLCLMRNAKLASLATGYEDATGTFTVSKDGKTFLTVNLSEPSGRAAAEEFFQAYMGR